MNVLDSMIYYLEYWVSLCGLDVNLREEGLGMFFIFFALVILIYAFYKAAIFTISPQEGDEAHCKYSVLE